MLGIAVSIQENANAALVEIQKVEKAVDEAEVEGKTDELIESKLNLNNSRDYFNDGKHQQANQLSWLWSLLSGST